MFYNRQQELREKYRRRQAAAKAMAGVPTKETRCYKILDEIYDLVDRHTDSNNTYETVLHQLALIAGEETGMHEHLGPPHDLYNYILKTEPGAENLYSEFWFEFWDEYTARVSKNSALIDPIGHLLEAKVVGVQFDNEAKVAQDNSKIFGVEKRGEGIDMEKIEGGHRVSVRPFSKPEYITAYDPNCATGRPGWDAVVYYPRTTIWNMEENLLMYRTALVTSKLLTPLTLPTLRHAVEPSEKELRLVRHLILHGNSVIVDISSPDNWIPWSNRWNPVDWRTDLESMNGMTWAELEQVEGENHAYEMTLERAASRKYAPGQRGIIISEHPDMQMRAEENVRRAQPRSMPQPQPTIQSMPNISELLGMSVDLLGTTETMVKRYIQEQEQVRGLLPAIFDNPSDAKRR